MFHTVFPIDRACGVDLGLESYPFIYFAAPEEEYLWRTVCVADCPMNANEADG